MDLDEVRSQKKPYHTREKQWGRQKTTQKLKDKSNVECYGCHKKGYYKNEYKASGKTQNKVSEMKKAVDHNNLYWSACYKDYCRAHDNRKENAGYYPGQGRQVCMVTHNEEDPDNYDTEPEHPSDQEQDAQLPQISEELSDTELGKQENSSSKKTEAEPSYPELEKALQEAEKKVYYIKK